MPSVFSGEPSHHIETTDGTIACRSAVSAPQPKGRVAMFAWIRRALRSNVCSAEDVARSANKSSARFSSSGNVIRQDVTLSLSFGGPNTTVPPGMTQQQFDQGVQNSGNNYSASFFYDPTGTAGPNSNSAANQIIQGAGGSTPNVPGAVGQYYWDIPY